MRRVKKSRGCWEWNGSTSPRNEKFTTVFYGVYTTRKPKTRRYYAHRFSYELHVGPIAKGLQLDHLCRNTICVNPEHLEPVTPRTNVIRGNTTAAAHAKKTHCPKGHAYVGANLIIHHGARECRTCVNVRQLDYYRRVRAPKNRARLARD